VRSKTKAKAKAARLFPISLMSHLPAPAFHGRLSTYTPRSPLPHGTWAHGPGHMAVGRGRTKTKAKDQLPSGQDMQ
jgi:hypothetical protein